MLKIMTWFWRQTPDRAGYDAEKVNRCLLGLSARLTLPHRLACVTDQPQGIDSSIECIPLPRRFDGIHVRRWSETSGLPQCYRRLELLAHDAEEIFGATDLVSLDMDVLFFGGSDSLDPLFADDVDFRIFAGTQRTNPYNGSMLRVRAGARADVFERFTADPVGVATEARQQHIGSDQAVLCHLLGPGERTWSEADGVFFYSTRLVRRSRGIHRDAKPDGIRVLFFPGHVKPWHDHVGADWIRSAWTGRRVSRDRVRFRAYRDPKGWGAAFSRAAKDAGFFCSLFTRARMVPTGIAFVRLDQAGRQREISKRLVAELNRKGIRTLPTAREACWYDDKGAQLEPLGRWMPHTAMFRDRADAEEYAKRARYPLVSKAIDSSGSKAVRLLADEAAALEECRRAFTAPGIPTAYTRRQLGYVYWQEFVDGNPCDYRICVVGGYVYGLVRENAPGSFKASGSGVFRPLTLADERERLAAKLGVDIADALRTQWMAFDVVFDGLEPLVLEMSSAWTMEAYAAAPCFTRAELAPTDRTGADSFEIAVDVMEAMWNE